MIHAGIMYFGRIIMGRIRIHVLITITLFFLHTGCSLPACNNKKQSNTKKLESIFPFIGITSPDLLEEIKKEAIRVIKESLLHDMSDERPNPEVLSEKEMMNNLIEDTFEYPHQFLEYLNNDTWKNASIGPIICVEDYTKSIPNCPYYYFVTAIDGNDYVLAMAYVFAMVNSDHAGKFGSSCESGPNTIPMKYMSKIDAANFIKQKYHLENDINIEIKAICLKIQYGDQYSWGWAIKLPNPITVTTAANEQYQGNVFYLISKEYDLTWLDKQPIQIKNDFINYLKIKPKFALLQIDIFDETKIDKIRKLSPNSPKEDWDLYNPKMINITYMQ